MLTQHGTTHVDVQTNFESTKCILPYNNGMIVQWSLVCGHDPKGVERWGHNFCTCLYHKYWTDVQQQHQVTA